MNCCWTNVDEQLDDGADPEICSKEARWMSCLPFTGAATCDEHKCRCAKALPPLGDTATCSPTPRHPVRVAGYTPDQLAERVANLRYDSMTAFFEALEQRFREDAVLDRARKRPKLANAGELMAIGIAMAKDAAAVAHNISKQHYGGGKERTS
jgi:hypothetical protein